MNQKRIIYIILGLLAGGILGAFWGDAINNMSLYSGLGAIVGVCLG